MFRRSAARLGLRSSSARTVLATRPATFGTSFVAARFASTSSAAAASSSTLKTAAPEDPATAALLSEASGDVDPRTKGANWSPDVQPTIMEHVDEGYEWIGELIQKIPSFEIINQGSDLLEELQPMLGCSWPVMMFLFGVTVRLSTLYFTLYGERASLRMQAAMPEIAPVYQEFEKVYYDPRASQKDVQRVSGELKAARDEVYKKHNTSNLKAMGTLAASPIFSLGFFTAMRATTRIEAMGNLDPPVLWLDSLQVADPFMIIPCLSLGCTILNFELLFRKKGGAKSVGTSNTVVWGARILALSFLTVVVNFRAGVMLYWFGVSATGLLQPLLMSNPTFCKLFRVPVPEDLIKASQVKDGVALARAKGVRQAEDPWIAAKAAVRGHIGVTGEANRHAPSAQSEGSSKQGPMTGKTLNEGPRKDLSAWGRLEAFYSKHLGIDKEHDRHLSKPKATLGDDPIDQRIGMTMPKLAQMLQPERVSQLSDDMETHNRREMSMAQKAKSWKAHKR